MTTMYHYPVKGGAVVSTCNLEFVRIRGRKMVQRSLVLYKLAEHKIAKFKPKFVKK